MNGKTRCRLGGVWKGVRMTANDLHVFLATFNRPEMMARQLDSILAQTVRPDVVTVLDNGDNPLTRELVEARAVRGARYVNTHDLGVQGNGKMVKRLCGTSGYVALFHDDDMVSPAYFEYVLKTVNSHPGVSLVVGEAEAMPASSMHFSSHAPHGRGLFLDGKGWAMLMFNCGTRKYPFAFYRADIYDALDIFAISDEFGRAGDIPLLLRAVGVDGTAAFLTYPFCSYGLHDGQDTHDPKTLPSAACFARFFGEFHRLMGDDLRTMAGFSYVFKCRRKLRSAYKRRCRKDMTYGEYRQLAHELGALPAKAGCFLGLSNHLTQKLLDAIVRRCLYSKETDLVGIPSLHNLI